MEQPAANPFVGPRAFHEDERKRFFGRDREIEGLASLLGVDHLILFYAPSGAGKTSLLNAGLIPQLRDGGYDVLPVARVSGDYPRSGIPVDNIFVFNVLSILDGGRSEPAALARATLADHLQDGAGRRVLIVDQFEEIFTSHPEAWEQRKVFFSQVAQAIAADPGGERRLWVILAMREEYIANLDPYAPLLPGRLRTRFYMQLLRREAALTAIIRPAEGAGRRFDPDVAEALVKNLSLVRGRDEGQGAYPGEFVEPLQLQVVCQRLWAGLGPAPEGAPIGMDDLRRSAGSADLAGFVDTALASFYEEAVREAAALPGLGEDEVRHWFSSELITEAGTRNLVFSGEERTGDLPNEAVDLLCARLLVHKVARPAGDWCELTHDRLVEPILQSNRVWYDARPIIRLARAWAEAGRPPTMMIEGELLKEAQAQGARELSPLVAELIDASAAAEAERMRQRTEREAALEAQIERERQVAASLRRRALMAAVAGALAVAGLLLALFAYRSAAEASRFRTYYALNLAGEAEAAYQRALPQRALLLGAEAAAASRDAWEPKVATTTAQTLRELLLESSTPLRDTADRPVLAAGPLALSSDRRWLAAAFESEQSVGLWDLSAPVDVAVGSWGPLDGTVTALDISPDAALLAIGLDSGAIYLVEPSQPFTPPRALAPPDPGAGVSALAFRPTGASLAVGDTAGSVTLVEVGSGRALTTPLAGHKGGVQRIVFSPDGALLATVDGGDALWVWDLNAAQPAASGKLLSKGKNGMLSFSSDGSWLAAGGPGSVDVSLWATDALDAPYLLKPESPYLTVAPGQIRALAFAAQEATLAVGYSEGPILVWRLPADRAALPLPAGGRNTAAPRPLALSPDLLNGHEGAVQALAFAPADPRMLASVGGDSLLRLWTLSQDLMQSKPTTLPAHEGGVVHVLFGPAGRLLTGGADNSLRLWERPGQGGAAPADTADSEELIVQACRSAGRSLSTAEREHYHIVDLGVTPACR
jgi:WD40 repeat protein